MGLISTHVDQTELGNGQFRNEINIKPIAFWQSGVLQRAEQSWEDSGDGAMPHAVTRSPLRTRTANDARRRIYPIPDDDSSWLEIGQPFVKIGGTWTQVSLGTPTRSGKTITWTRPQTITTITHGIHFVKLEIELRNGFVPEDSMIAFPVNINGLTRSGTEIRKNGVPVMQLRPFVMFDAANEQDIRPIAHQFTNLNSQPYLLLTLPSLTGMTRPVIDPTLTLQPDGASGLDSFIGDYSPTTNFGTSDVIFVGDVNAGLNQAIRSMIRFDLSSLPLAATVTAATLSMFEYYASDSPGVGSWAVGLRRLLRDWIEAQVTWNIYSTGNNWTTAGASSNGNDRAASDSASLTLDGTAANAFVNWTSATLADDVQKMRSGVYGNYGWLIQAPTIESPGVAQFGGNGWRSAEFATAAQRPQLVITYTLPTAGRSFFVAPFQAPFGSLFG